MLHKKEFHKLNKRSIIKISGKDKFSFIQGIISNDIEILKKKIQFIRLFSLHKENFYQIFF